MSLYIPCLPRLARTPSHHTQWRRIVVRCYASTAAENPPWFQQLRSEMLSRPIISSREHLNVNTDQKLIDTLATFLPSEWLHRSKKDRVVIPLGHHLLWFNTSMPADQLLPDGTDPLQSPGDPWVRRMWAGGHLELRPEAYHDIERGFTLNSEMLCAERIQDVQLRGIGDTAKIFVTIERRFAQNDTLHANLPPLRAKYGRRAKEANPQWHFREQLLNEVWGDAILKEERNLVFLKEKTSTEVDAIKAGQMTPIKYLDCRFPAFRYDTSLISCSAWTT
jgi:hydroxyacyl-ACP dehydratase HTD2-like protein with hotdog domain